MYYKYYKYYIGAYAQPLEGWSMPIDYDNLLKENHRKTKKGVP